MASRELTAEAFVERRWDVPDAGWTELDAGRMVWLEPPDEVHGNVALHLSKLVADFVGERPDSGCPAFDLGLVVSRGPDTVRFPLLSWFATASRFEWSDADLCESPPELVIDVVSTPDRRAMATERVLDFLEWGVDSVWQLDTEQRTVVSRDRGAAPRRFHSGETFLGHSQPFTLQAKVDDLFAHPTWWTG